MRKSCLGATPGGWKIAGIDPDGADLQRGDEVLRLEFETPVYSRGAAQAAPAKLGEITRNE
jgi:heme iron utilization protein